MNASRRWAEGTLNIYPSLYAKVPIGAAAPRAADWMCLSVLVLGLVAGMLSAPRANGAERPTLEPARNEFTFVVLGDSQFDDPPAFNRLVDEAALLHPAFVVQVGDLIQGYSDDEHAVRQQWRRFRAEIQGLGDIPYFPVAGNHDLYGADGKPSRMLEEVYRDIWGDPYYAFSYRNARFIVLDTDERGAPEEIGEAQLSWLQDELTTTNAEHIFVFMHRPPSSLGNAEALHELLKRFPVAIVFFGHLHHYEQYERDGIRYVMTNATGAMGTDYPEAGSIEHLLQVRVRDADVSFVVIPVDALLAPDFSAPEDNAALFALRRSLLAPATMAPEDLTKEDDGWSLKLLLSNPTEQTLYAYLAWSSPDQRWLIGPETATRVTLPPHTENKAIPFTLRRRGDVPTEGWPTCTLQAPYLTSKGKWVTVTRVFSVKESQQNKD